MRALTLKHPWAFAIAHLGKRIENRSWKPWPSIIGEFIAIHGGAEPKGNALRESNKLGYFINKQFRAEITKYQGEKYRGRPAYHSHADMITPGIVAIARVTGYVTESESPWFEGPVGWTLDEVHTLPEPIQITGAQGLWEVPTEIVARIKAIITL